MSLFLQSKARVDSALLCFESMYSCDSYADDTEDYVSRDEINGLGMMLLDELFCYRCNRYCSIPSLLCFMMK